MEPRVRSSSAKRRSLKWKPPSIFSRSSHTTIVRYSDWHSGGRCRPVRRPLGPLSRDQQRHSPVGDIGVIKSRLKGLVLDQHALIRRERVMHFGERLVRSSRCGGGCSACRDNWSRRRARAKHRASAGLLAIAPIPAGDRSPACGLRGRDCRSIRTCTPAPQRDWG